MDGEGVEGGGWSAKGKKEYGRSGGVRKGGKKKVEIHQGEGKCGAHEVEREEWDM